MWKREGEERLGKKNKKNQRKGNYLKNKKRKINKRGWKRKTFKKILRE